MGIAQSIQQNMKKNMDAQMAFQKELILKQRQAQMATQIAMGRQRLKYYYWFSIISIPSLIIGSIARKKPQMIAPVLPISFSYAYQYDLFYGDMFERVQIQADKLIVQYPSKFYLPQHTGIISQPDYEQIMSIKDGKKVV